MLKFKFVVDQHIKLIKEVLNNNYNDYMEAFKLIKNCLKKNNAILLCGNGGSASDLQHFSAELVGKFKNKYRKNFHCQNLSSNFSSVTAIANDFGYEDIFSRQLKALATKKDLVILASTSGKSSNILKAINYCQTHNIKTIGLFGSHQNEYTQKCTRSIYINSTSTARVQEVHYLILHSICEDLENYF